MATTSSLSDSEVGSEVGSEVDSEVDSDGSNEEDLVIPPNLLPALELLGATLVNVPSSTQGICNYALGRIGDRYEKARILLGEAEKYHQQEIEAGRLSHPAPIRLRRTHDQALEELFKVRFAVRHVHRLSQSLQTRQECHCGCELREIRRKRWRG